jgi:hypothetical protein
MLNSRDSWSRGAWLAAGIAAAVLIVVVVWVLFVPAADWLAHQDVGSVKGALHETAVDNARGRLLTLGAGLFAAGALWFTARSFVLAREGQVTDRYTAAIKQLGSKKIDVRIGGIYALERVARDSKTDHPTVMEVLAAFIREHSREQMPADKSANAPANPTVMDVLAAFIREHSREQMPADKSATAPANPPNRPDVQAAFTVITRRIVKRDIRPIDLTGASLPGEDFIAVRLIGASLVGADLTGARMIGAKLTVADLRGANLTGADLVGAELNGARLNGANLTGADLFVAKLAGANLTDAILLDAKSLDGANLTDASLGGAWWPAGTPVPEGWQLDSTSRRLERRAATLGQQRRTN